MVVNKCWCGTNLPKQSDDEIAYQFCSEECKQKSVEREKEIRHAITQWERYFNRKYINEINDLTDMLYRVLTKIDGQETYHIHEFGDDIAEWYKRRKNVCSKS